MSLIRTSEEFLTSRSHDVNMYPIEPFKDGRAFMEYDVLKSGFGDLEMEKWRPLGTLKSRRAVEYRGIVNRISHNSFAMIDGPFDVRVRLAYKLSSFQPVLL